MKPAANPVTIASRYFRGGDLGPLDKNGEPVDGYPLANPPPLGTGRALDKDTIDRGLLALAHGMPAEYAPGTIARGTLRSSMRRLGPKGRYSREADVRGGGAAAVYTRAVVSVMRNWHAGGHGVGSGDGRAQLIIAPQGLFGDDDRWHCASLDNMGFAPGAKAARVNPGDINAAWQCQTRDKRYVAMRDLISTGSGAHNNEVMHWDDLDLTGRLLGVFIVSPNDKAVAPFKADAQRFTSDVSRCIHAPAVQASPPRGAFRVGEGDYWVPVYSLPKRDMNIAGWIREASRKWREAHRSSVA